MAKTRDAFGYTITVSPGTDMPLSSLLAENTPAAIQAKAALLKGLKSTFSDENWMFLEKLYQAADSSDELKTIIDNHIPLTDKRSSVEDEDSAPFAINVSQDMKKAIHEAAKAEDFDINGFTKIIGEMCKVINTNIPSVSDIKPLISSVEKYKQEHKKEEILLKKLNEDTQNLIKVSTQMDAKKNKTEETLLANLAERTKSIADNNNPQQVRQYLLYVLQDIIQQKQAFGRKGGEPLIGDSPFLAKFKEVFARHSKELPDAKEAIARIAQLNDAVIQPLEVYHPSTKTALDRLLPDSKTLKNNITNFRSELLDSYKAALGNKDVTPYFTLSDLVNGCMNVLATYKTDNEGKLALLSKLAEKLASIDGHDNPKESCKEIVILLKSINMKIIELDKRRNVNAEKSDFVKNFNSIIQKAEMSMPELKEAKAQNISFDKSKLENSLKGEPSTRARSESNSVSSQGEDSRPSTPGLGQR